MTDNAYLNKAYEPLRSHHWEISVPALDGETPFTLLAQSVRFGLANGFTVTALDLVDQSTYKTLVSKSNAVENIGPVHITQYDTNGAFVRRLIYTKAWIVGDVLPAELDYNSNEPVYLNINMVGTDLAVSFTE